MIYRLRKEFRFEASHVLKDHDGKCANLHGHSWTGYIEVSGKALQKDGPKRNMLFDYNDLKPLTKMIEDALDHQHLNTALDSEMPTSEFVANWIWKQTEEALKFKKVKLSRVVIRETCTTECILENDK